MRSPLYTVALLAGVMLASSVYAQQPAAPAAPPAAAPATPAPPTPYGLPIDLAHARKAADAAMVQAKKNGFPSAIAIVGPAGDLILLEKMDNSNMSTSRLAQQKARSAAAFRRPTKFFEDALASRPVIGQLGLTAVGGGIPIVMNGKVVGAIGASGAPSSDGDISAAQAGLEVLK